MKSLFTLLSLLCCFGLLNAQNRIVEVSGRVFYGSAALPARSVPVQLITENGNRTFVTDAEGRYKASMPVFLSPNGYAKVTVEVRDICMGQSLSKALLAIADSLVYSNINFTVCANSTPPAPPNECKAFFTFKENPDDPKTILFQDLSVPADRIFKWTWNFGDSTRSNERNPTHTYANNGSYIVSLTIAAETTDTICSASYRTSVYVRDVADCNCTREYLPVCVVATNGALITFPNKCLALCAGYSEFQIGACQDSTCICPAVYDPVCVKLPDGTIQQFGNACEAACKGFTRADFVSCTDPCDCPTDEYIPVCVVVNGDTVEYTNACRAKCAGFKETDFIQCDTTRGCACPEYYAPVCVVNENGDTLTFSNKCFAYCEGYEPEDLLECRPNDCVCDAVYDPVCVGLFDGTIKQFSNACEAQCAGFEPSVFLPCDTSNCACPKIYDPVCVATPNGGFLRFANKCLALCEGYTENMLVPCDTTSCNCPKILDPVCAVGPNGDTLTFTNRCFAACEGYNPEQLFQCRPNSCICPPVIDPVCVRLADGNIIRYNSQCEALCNGFKETDIVACDSTSCVCPEYYDPVCVITSSGDTLTFDNPCFARCKGYKEGDWFRCGRNTGECGCPLNLDPVCVKVDGYLKRFPNACVAKCYGFTETDFVPCVQDSSDCVCPLYYAPVCAIGPNGDTLTFSNPCFATCAGYEDHEIFTCNTSGGTDTLLNCTAAFSAILRDSFSLTVDFKDFAKVTEGTILGWKWDFGDGNYGDSQNPTHTYARPGIYTVTQYIATSTGCSTSATRTIYVGLGDVISSSRCQAIFTFTQDPSNPNQIYFKNLFVTPISATTWHWDFGDGYTSTEPSPTHTYGYNGVFFVRLTVRSGDCVSTTSMVIFIDPNAIYENECNALFLPVLFVDSLQVAFRNMSSSDATEFRWDFGDGTTSTAFAPLHTYQEQGIYNITLTITTRSGCTNTFRATLNLGTQNFTGNPEYKVTTTSTDDKPILRQLKVYPNPVKQEATLEFNTTAAGSYLLQIFSMEGRLMQTIRESAQFGNNLIQFDTNHLPAGMYLLRVQTAGQVQSIKFIKQ